MAQKIKIGYFEHWFQPPYKFVDFLREQGIEIEKINFHFAHAYDCLR